MGWVIKQIEPVIHVVTPLGKGLACFLQCDDFDVFWQVFQRDTGESWWWDNHLVRMQPSITGHHTTASPIVLPENEKQEFIRRGYKFPSAI